MKLKDVHDPELIGEINTLVRRVALETMMIGILSVPLLYFIHLWFSSIIN